MLSSWLTHSCILFPKLCQTISYLNFRWAACGSILTYLPPKNAMNFDTITDVEQLADQFLYVSLRRFARLLAICGDAGQQADTFPYLLPRRCARQLPEVVLSSWQLHSYIFALKIRQKNYLRRCWAAARFYPGIKLPDGGLLIQDSFTSTHSWCSLDVSKLLLNAWNGFTAHKVQFKGDMIGPVFVCCDHPRLLY